MRGVVLNNLRVAPMTLCCFLGKFCAEVITMISKDLRGVTLSNARSYIVKRAELHCQIPLASPDFYAELTWPDKDLRGVTLSNYIRSPRFCAELFWEERVTK